MAVKVSVVVPVHNPGDRILRVMRSLDRQTLPADEFEAILVDDGSTDGTAERLGRIAAHRPYVRLARLEGSGWPSWPRNLGIELASGEYVLFMDHDDELGDDALRRAYDYAVANGSDVVIGKEVAVGRSALDSRMFRHNVARASILEHRLLDLLTVHRLFRREFLLAHRIRFPERVGLLEDHPFALKSFLEADVVSILADYPVYKWIVSDENNSRQTPQTETYFANIRECLDLVESHTSPGPERDAMMLRWLQGSVAGSIGPRMLTRPEGHWREWVDAVRTILEERFPRRLDELAAPMHRLRLAVGRAGDLDAVLALARFEQGSAVRAEASSYVWVDGALQVRARGVLLDASGAPMAFERAGERVVRRLPAELAAYAPDGLLDVTSAVEAAAAELKLRHRDSRVEWYVPGTSSARLEQVDGRLALVAECTSEVDPAVAALGAPLEPGVWDVVFWMQALGYDLRPRLAAAPARPAPALVDGEQLVAYRTKDGRLALDVGATVRTLVGSARPTPDDATVRPGPDGSLLRLALPRVHVRGQASVPGGLALEAAILEGSVELPARLVADAGDARVEAYVTALAGRYGLRATFGEGPTTQPFLDLEAADDGTYALVPVASPDAKPAAVGAALAQRPAPQAIPVGRRPVLGGPVLRRVRRLGGR
ncbi:glycosyltransferase family 2 protein [Motilibacter deserti]|uniref:Glycosyltransferase family 2 protein n=1 Tax=Motilibacter deserti TaxID=2714956 RepID=A0ABX0GZM0_9ACTN|nr:glycosyltransferase family 2 protein [Motilibacter deserti]